MFPINKPLTSPHSATNLTPHTNPMLSLASNPLSSFKSGNQSYPSTSFPAKSFIPATRTVSLRASTACVSAVTAPSSSYDVLGIPTCASSDEIKAAYRRLARSCHPDVTGGKGGKSTGEEFIKLCAAYSTLSDPDKRADYDRKFFVRSPVVRNRYSGISMSVPLSFCSSPRRNWESDQCW